MKGWWSLAPMPSSSTKSSVEVEVNDLVMVVFVSGIDTMASEAGRDMW